MRGVVLMLLFVPFVYFGGKDMAFHFRGRKVSITEHVLHLGIGITQAMLFVQALRGNVVLMFVALGMFLVTGSIDEYIFHRALPAEESDLHAKEHLALFIFVVVALAMIGLEKNNWRVPFQAGT